MRSTFAIVPVKPLALAKGRLSGRLSASQRERLARTMLADVLAVLVRTAGIDNILVVTSDPEVVAIARAAGVEIVREADPKGLNAALGLALAQALGEGAARALIVPADVPLATPAEIGGLLKAADDRDVVAIAPDAARAGTNALLVPLPPPFDPAFGEGSFRRHLEMCRAAGLRVKELRLDGLSHDIDTPADLAKLVSEARYHFIGATSMNVLDATAARALAGRTDTQALMAEAEAATLAAHGTPVTFSKKVFIPLTQLCRDVCHYCTFAQAPRGLKAAFLAPDEVLAIARTGAAQDCKEALFTLGDKPELRYSAAREALDHLGFASTLDYVEAMAARVLKETGLLPHINAGIMDEAWARRLREVSGSQGLMLETAADRLSAKGGPHFGSPDKLPSVRLEAIEAAGRAGVPFTTGLLIGIGESRLERVEALLHIRDLHERHGHIQEVIIQNFRAKPGTRMAGAAEPSLEEHLWTVAAARLILGSEMSIQAPPNLQPEALSALIRAGINDWGGVSPLTPDHVNPEAPWPHLERLSEATAAAGRTLTERLTVYPRFIAEPERWLAKPLRTPVLRLMDSEGLGREDGWAPGNAALPPPVADARLILSGASARSRPVERVLAQIAGGVTPGEAEIVTLFAARGDDFAAVCKAADDLRRRRVGNDVTYVVNRNINYTNICTYGCKFCAFSKGRLSTEHRDKPYNLDLEEVAERTREAWARGATEVCLQGGIAPRYTGETYLNIVEAVKIGAPDIHVHAFSPLEVWHGATTLKMGLRDYLARLRAVGLSSLPGTAAEILDDEVRQVLCPDKITTDQWLEVMRAAHDVGLKSTATIMFGHVDRPVHWARHLLRVRELQAETGGFTELVPLAFVHMESPIYLRGQARKGPTFRESILMHAVARLVLDPLIPNIQASWVKLGPDGAALALAAGANDVGGTLMNESITRAAGAAFGQEMTPIAIERMIRAAGRVPRQRSTFYGGVADERLAVGFADCEIRPMSMMAAQ